MTLTEASVTWHAQNAAQAASPSAFTAEARATTSTTCWSLPVPKEWLRWMLRLPIGAPSLAYLEAAQRLPPCWHPRNLHRLGCLSLRRCAQDDAK